MSKTIQIIGLKHEEDSPNFQKILEILDKQVKPGMKIGLELSPHYSVNHTTKMEEMANDLLENQGLPKIVKVKKTNTIGFFDKLSKKISEKGGQTILIDHPEYLERQIALAIALDRLDKLRKEGLPVSALKSVFQKLRVIKPKVPQNLEKAYQALREKYWIEMAKRSKHLLDQTNTEDLSIIVVGAQHARDIKLYAPAREIRNKKISIIYQEPGVGHSPLYYSTRGRTHLAKIFNNPRLNSG